jgi:hypothetical protein
MSDLTSAKAAFRGPAIQSGHGSATKRDRKYLSGGFVVLLWKNGIKLRHPREVQVEHVRLYVQLRIALGHDPRSIQNGLCALRNLLSYRNRKAFARSAEMLSPALGCPPGCRKGTNDALPPSKYLILIRRAEELDEGLACALRLQRTLGLRRREAIRSVESLDEWENQLIAGEPVHLRYGAKTNRPRFIRVPDTEAALAAIRAAREVCAKRGGVLIEGSLRKAVRRYEYFMGTECLAVKGHSLRYAFAHERYLKYVAEGIEPEEALMKVVSDLGHGEKRGRWGRDIYLLSLVPVRRRPKKASRLVLARSAPEEAASARTPARPTADAPKWRCKERMRVGLRLEPELRPV